MATSYRYGIDLGTTNSSIAIVEMGTDGKKDPVIFKVDYNNQPHEVIKSIVGFKNSEEIVGDDGMFSLQGTEDNPVRQVKMKLIANEKDGDIPSVPGKRYTDAMAAILKKLKDAADEGMRDAKIKPSGVVMGIPCELGDNQESIKYAYCLSLKKAGFFSTLDEAKAGTAFLDEPCAVALFYGNKALYQNKQTMIFDFGGGTLDLAIVKLERQSLADVVNTSAHKVIAKTSLYGAGELFTEILFKDVFFPAFRDQHCAGSAWNVAKLFKKLGCTAMRADDIYRELTQKAGACWKFVRELEVAKAKLSFDRTYEFYFEAEAIDGSGKVIFETTIIERDDFENALRPQLLDIKEVINNRLFTPSLRKEKNVTKDSIEKVILAGGSSSIPCVRELIKDMFPNKVVYDGEKQGPYFVNMMTCISQGLAIQGYYDDPTQAIDNVTAYAYGIGDAFSNGIQEIIPKNTNYSATDINLSKNGLIPETEYAVDVEQVNKNSSAFYLDIYEDKNKIMKLYFDKKKHSGYYRVFFRIDAVKGILEVKVYDTTMGRWVEDLRKDQREYRIGE